MRELRIAVMPGDFIGPEVVAEGLKVLDAESRKYGFATKLTNYPHGGKHYLETGETLPDSVIDELRQHDAIYFGAVGYPSDMIPPGVLEKGVLLKMRFDLDQYANVRPTRLYRGVQTPLKTLKVGDELVVVRENTEDVYRGYGFTYKMPGGEVVAVQQMTYTGSGVDRINKFAFELATKMAKRRGRQIKLTLGHKANVLEYVFKQLWVPRFYEMAKRYPDVKAEDRYIDAISGPGLIGNPGSFDVIVTSNMFGDIITDLTAAIYGGMGVAASGNINPDGVSMFEPIHGSSPKDAGKNVVSPIGAILSMKMLLEYLGEKLHDDDLGFAAHDIESSVEDVLAEGKIPNFTVESGVPTQQQTEYVLERIRGS